MNNIRGRSKIIARLNVTDVIALAGIAIACLIFAFGG
jgi:hypothetical protein